MLSEIQSGSNCAHIPNFGFLPNSHNFINYSKVMHALANAHMWSRIFSTHMQTFPIIETAKCAFRLMVQCLNVCNAMRSVFASHEQSSTETSLPLPTPAHRRLSRRRCQMSAMSSRRKCALLFGQMRAFCAVALPDVMRQRHTNNSDAGKMNEPYCNRQRIYIRICICRMLNR